MNDVAIFMGSISDKEAMLPAKKVLDELGIRSTLTVTSAHRTPDRTRELVRKLENQGTQVFICAAGLAAHLAGAVAAQTEKPVLGVPLNASSLGGMDALLSTVQMPPGFPVATLALGSVGAKNAAWLAAQILALQEPALRQKIAEARDAMRQSVEKAASELEEDSKDTPG